ncbi:MAG: hypothetical protein GY826_04735, partial [Fuerstiella sp.]|nr:hypothetical protein [Fuerstiella sp.]
MIVFLFVAVCCHELAAQDLFSGIDPDGFDHSVRPQDDLYQHVNGRWLLSTQIPADKSNYGSFTALDDAARENIRTIIEDATKNPVDANGQKVGDFYSSFMNEKLIDERGLKPIQPALDAIADLSSKQDLFRHFGRLQTMGIRGPIGFFVSTDAKDSSRYLAAIVQSGTTLPDRDYYLKDDEKYLTARAALKKYIIRLFELAGLSDGQSAADQILQLETKLAKAQWSRTELRDAEKRYNRYAVSDLPELTPKLPWSV